MYFWFVAVFVIVENFIQISGIQEELKLSICKSYENQGYEKMYDEILKMHDRVLAKQEVDPCVIHMQYITEIDRITLESVEVQNEVITGDFGDDTGYELIVDETVTIDIPAILKCVYKLKYAKNRMQYGREKFEYYFVMYRTDDDFHFSKTSMADTISNKNVSVFVLRDSVLHDNLLQHYKHQIREYKSLIKTWFQRKQSKPNKLKDFCKSFSSFGKPKESSLGKQKMSSHGKQKKSSSAEWKVISGRVEIGPKILRVSSDTEVELIGIIVCEIIIIHDEKSTIEKEYFTMSKYEKNDNDKMFVGIYGPKKVGDKQIFAVEPRLLEKDRN